MLSIKGIVVGNSFKQKENVEKSDKLRCRKFRIRCAIFVLFFYLPLCGTIRFIDQYDTQLPQFISNFIGKLP